MTTIALVPYVRTDGAWSLADDVILDLARRCRDEGLFDRVFHDGKIKEPAEFLAALQLPENLPVFIYVGAEPIGFAWLNGIAGFHAFAHFCFIDPSDALEAGRAVLQYWSSFQSIEVIIGLIAASNVAALGFAQRLGFESVGYIPRMLNVHGKKTAGFITYRDNRACSERTTSG
jgi:hypothetical protein